MKHARNHVRFPARRAALAVVLALATTGARAQEPPPAIAKLRDVVGSVLVSAQGGMAAAVEAQRILKGSSVITTANSSTVVVFDNGCEVRMQENQRLEVDSDRECAALVPTGLGVASPAVGPGLAALLVPGAVVVPAVPELVNPTPPTPVSPN